MGIEPTPSAWKAEVLPLNYTRKPFLLTLAAISNHGSANLVVGEGFEPSKAEPSDLQSDPVDRLGTPQGTRNFSRSHSTSQSNRPDLRLRETLKL